MQGDLVRIFANEHKKITCGNFLRQFDIPASLEKKTCDYCNVNFFMIEIGAT